MSKKGLTFSHKHSEDKFLVGEDYFFINRNKTKVLKRDKNSAICEGIGTIH